MAGNPQLDSNPATSLDFTIATGSTNSIDVNHGAAPSPLVFSSTTAFAMGAQLEIHGTSSGGWFAFPVLTLTFKYFAENLETGAATLLALLLVPITNGTLDTVSIPNKITFTSSVTKVSLAAGTLPVGIYKITCIVTFTPNIGMNAFTEGPIIEVFT